MKKVIIIILFISITGIWTGYLYWKKLNSNFSESLTLYGNVEIRQVEVAFRVSGRIDSMLMEEGQTVQSGDILAKLDSIPIENEVFLAQANEHLHQANLDKALSGSRPEEIDQAMAVLDEVKATVTNLKQTLDRVQTLGDRGGVSQQSVDDAKAAYRVGVARLEVAQKQADLVLAGARAEDITALQAALDSAKINVEKARLALSDTILHAPQDGVILTKAREIGAIVQAGQSVYTISLVAPVYIRAYVPQPRLGLIRPGMPVEIGIDAILGKTYPGQIGFISHTAEFTPKSVETMEVRNDLVFRVRIVAEDPDNILRQGMPVTITIKLD